MAIEFDGRVARLSGICKINDAEPLLSWLEEAPGRIVDLSELSHPHTAVLQVILAKQPEIQGLQAGSELRAWLEPLLTKSDAAALVA